MNPQPPSDCNVLSLKVAEDSASDNGCLRNLEKRKPRAGFKGGRHKTSTALQRLVALAQADSPCWILSGYVDPRNGHLIVSRGDGTRTHVGRLAYELFIGPIPEGYVVCYRCDDGRCINPAHLVAATRAENIHDSICKGRYNTFGRQKLNAVRVQEIRAQAALGFTHKHIAERFGVGRSAISMIVGGKSWAHLPSHVPSVRPLGSRAKVQTIASRA